MSNSPGLRAPATVITMVMTAGFVSMDASAVSRPLSGTVPLTR